MTVYADVLLIINLFVNYALLLCSAKIMKNPVPRLRILLGSAVGSVYGLVIFLPEIPKPLELIMRIAVTALIVFCTFGFTDIRKFLRCFFTFFAVSMGFGGVMLVLWITVAPVGMVYNNGTVYFDVNLAVLAVSTVVCFAVISIISFFIERRAPRESSAVVTVYVSGKSVKLNAIIDTGNSLRETFSGYPVAVAEKAELKDIMPQSIIDYFENKTESENTGIRLVIHKTVSGTGVMPAFRPDYVEIRTVSRKIKTDKLYIAVTENNLAGGEYSMLLNPEIINGEKNNAETSEKTQKSYIKA